jgi:serine/threonine-protein kinase
MSAPSPSADAREIDRLCDQFEAEWRAGGRPRIEDHLGRAAPPLRPGLLRHLLALELELRVAQGERPPIAEYRKRFPDDPAAVEAAYARPAPTLPAPTRPAGERAGGATLSLTVTDGPHKGQVFTFAGHEVFLAGRSLQAHLSVPQDKRASRNHFLIETNLPDCRLTDLGSRNGTFVNGQRVPSADLRDGDEVRAGATTLRVTIRAGGTEDNTATLGPDSAVTEPPPPAAAPARASLETIYRDSAPGPFAATDPMFPRVPGYRVERELGRGGMGIVYLVVGEKDGAHAALKTIRPAAAVSHNQVQRFLREANILCQLRHPNIVAFREVGESDGLLWFAMDYVEGTDAARLLKAQGPLPVRTAVRMICQLLSALEYAHGKGFVHRDIKPANLLVADEGGKKLVKLADFGLARVYQESRMSGLTIQGDMGGTVAFMPPEQIIQFRQVKPAADQYSAAAALYNLLTGLLLFGSGAPREQTLTCALQEEPVPIGQRRADVPDELALVIHRALAKEAASRYPNVHALRAALTPFAQ